MFTVQDDYSTSLSDGGDDQLHLKKCVATTLEYTYPVSAPPIATYYLCVVSCLAINSNYQLLTALDVFF